MIETCKQTGCQAVPRKDTKFCAVHAGLASSGEYLPHFPATVTPRAKDPRGEFSGGDVNYYLLEITDPKRTKPCTVECEDIIEALEMTFAEGNIFKALWRSCNMRAHGHGKRGQDADGTYDGDKVAYYGERVKVQRRRKLKKTQAARELTLAPKQ